MELWIKYLICIPIAYLVGSVNFATIIAKFRKTDIKKKGSGNPGTMNMLRSVGKFWGCLTFLLDFFKGVGIALLGKFFLGAGGNEMFAIYLLGLITVIGHVFSCFLKFKGGKGVATSIGVFGVGNPIAMLVAFVLLIIYLAIFKVGFLGSLLLTYGLTITEAIINRQDWRITILLVTLSMLITFTHRKNIIRFIKGKENSLSLFKKDSKSSEPPDSVEDNDKSQGNNQDKKL